VGAVIVTTVVTLTVAALALLGPLEHNLRKAEIAAFRSQLRNVAAPFKSQGSALALIPTYYRVRPPAITPRMSEAEREEAAQDRDLIQQASRERQAVIKAENALQSRVGASEVTLVGRNASGQPVVVARFPESAVNDSASLGNLTAALASHKQQLPISTGSSAGSEYAVAHVPFTTRSATATQRWVLVVRKSFEEVNNAVSAVRTAFFDAALAALALTLLLAIPLAFRIVRRLRRLREAALELASGGHAVRLPTDRARDEVGDLARAFALMRAQLQQQEEARRAFVATASHELRTPLTSLEGMLELLAEDLADAQPDLDDARSLLARARAQSHRLGRLAADLLDLSRIDAQVSLRSEPVELAELSRAVLAEFELGTTERSISSDLHDAGSPVWALGDPGSVAQILRILLDNAMRVSPPGSQITVQLRGGEQASLSVCDEGPGVPAAERDLIFHRFHRGSSTGGEAGFGLGLAIGRELAQRMGGELVLEDSPGPGAQFTLLLPVASAPDHDRVTVA
jgi:signal transduction histidine kinase